MSYHIVVLSLVVSLTLCRMKYLTTNQNDYGLLFANQFSQYTLSLPQRSVPGHHLFIKLDGVLSDTLSTPVLRVFKDDLEYPCSQLLWHWLCIIDNVAPGSKLSMTVHCLTECVYNLTSYQAKELKMGLGEEVPVRFAAAEPFQAVVEVKEDIDDREVEILATVNNPDDVQAQIAMYVNVGYQRPTPEKHLEKGKEFWNDGVAVFLKGSKLKKGTKIRLYVQGSPDMEATISCVAIKNQREFDINQKVYGEIEKGETNRYLLNLTHRQIHRIGLDIFFKVVHYTGKVKISISPVNILQPGKFVETNLNETSIQVILGWKTRQKLGFDRLFYIFIQGLEDSTYVLQCKADRLEYMVLDPEISEISTLENKDEIDNYVFNLIDRPTEYQQQNLREYVLDVRVLNGSLRYGVRRCSNLENGEIDNCAFKKMQHLEANRSEFDEIVALSGKISESFTKKIKYDLRNCTDKRNGMLHCAFQIVIFNPSHLTPLTYILKLQEFENKIPIVNGRPKKDRGLKDQIKQYVFHVTEKDIQSVQFYLTVFSGQCFLAASTVLPTDKTSIDDLQLATNNHIFYKQNISQTYYLQVHSLEFSHYTLLGVIKQKHSQTATSKAVLPVHLTEGVVQFLSLNPVQSNISLFLQVQAKKQFYVRANCLKGSVQFGVHPITQGYEFMELPVWKSARQIAHIKNSRSTAFLVVITSKSPAMCSFVYNKEGVCAEYQLGQRVSVELAEQQSTCFGFSLNKTTDIEVVFGTQLFEMYSGSLTAEMSFNKGYKATLTTRSIAFKSREVSQYCPQLANTGGVCKLTLYAETKSPMNLTTIVREASQQLELLDGLQQYAKAYISRTHQRQFYYDPQGSEPISVVVKSSSDTLYRVVGKFVPWADFLSSKQSLFPSFDNTSLPFADTQVHGSTLLTIDKLSEVTAGKHVLLLSLFSKSVTQAQADFSIEVVQNMAKLLPSQVRLGLVGKSQTKSYLITAKSNEQIIVRTEGSKDECLKMSVYKQGENSSILAASYNNQLVFTPEINQNYVVEVMGNAMCSYQIFYSPLGKQVFEILHGHPLDLKLNNSEVVYLLYHNIRRQSFRIVSMAEDGKLRLRAHPILQSLSTMNQLPNTTSTFEFSDSPNSSSLTIGVSDHNFCSNCYYLIEITADRPSKATVVLHSVKSAVTLKQNRVVRETLGGQGQPSMITYGLALATAFRLRIEVSQGVLAVSINRDGGVSIQKKITESRIIDVNAPGKRINDTDSASWYTIRVNCEDLCSYSLSADSKTGFFNEGEPYAMAVTTNDEESCAEFSVQKQGTSHLFVGSSGIENIKYELTCRRDGEKECEVKELVKKKEGNKQVLKLELEPIEGIFEVCLTLIDQKSPQDTTLLLTKNMDFQLLQPNYSLAFPYLQNSAAQLYQMFNPTAKKPIFQLFQCTGQVDLQVASDYQSLKSQLSADHLKTAGHYITKFNPNIANPFLYARVQGVKGQPAKYLPKYSFYEGESSPYSAMAVADAQITYEIDGEEMLFTVRSVNMGGESVERFDYRVYVAKDANTLKSAVQCETSMQVLTQNVKVNVAKNRKEVPDQVTFSIKLEDISDLLQGKTLKSYLYISASCTASLTSTNKYRYIYQTLQLSTSAIEFNNASVFREKVKYAVIWLILPIFAAALLLYLSFRFCCRRVQYLPYSDVSLASEVNEGVATNATESAAIIREREALAETGKVLVQAPSEKKLAEIE